MEAAAAVSSERKPWYVYLLLCRGGRLYTGVTPDLRSRMRKHRSGAGARFTRGHPPEQLLAARPFGSKSEALVTEYRIKRLSVVAKRVLAATWSQEHPIPAEVHALFAPTDES